MNLDQNKTHLSKYFFTVDEIKTLESGKKLLRVEPMSQGGKCYLIERGGFHFAVMQQILSWGQ